MIQSSQPRKERRFRFNAPMHVRQKFVHVHVAKELSSKLGIKKRSVQLRRGDTVRVMSGKQRGRSGKVLAVSMQTGRVLIDGITRKDAKGKEMQIPIYSSNLYIIDIDTSDKLRAEKLGVARSATPQQTPKVQKIAAPQAGQQPQATRAEAAQEA
jgi:large subunit ribosomal protein L24